MVSTWSRGTLCPSKTPWPHTRADLSFSSKSRWTCVANSISVLPSGTVNGDVAFFTGGGSDTLTVTGKVGGSLFADLGGGADAVTPTSIRWSNDAQPFVNTGRKVIARYSYLYDAAAGLEGWTGG